MSFGRFPAFMFTNDPEQPRREVVEIDLDVLSPDGVLIEVEWSSVNYKDGLATSPSGKVARISPLIPGVDLAGTVVDPGGSRFLVGQKVIAHAYDIGTAHHGGYARYARVPSDWVLDLPDGLTTRDAMVIGTGGFTSAESVMALLDRGLRPADGPVLVTGATGGVGSMAVSMLSALGFEVVASSGKREAEPYLMSLGATRVIDRSDLSTEDPKPLGAMTFAGAVDCVGGVTLANVLKRLRYGGSVAASGLTGGAGLTTTVMPFILRGVALLGIDSVQLPMPQRVEVWRRLADDLRPAGIDRIGQEIDLNDLDPVLTSILRGEVTGRYVVRPTVG
ncbi:MAG: oxidoreductase [Actinobacteria bacterium]|nr:oxidoreductase [Actinomycetota bacterium]